MSALKKAAITSAETQIAENFAAQIADLPGDANNAQARANAAACFNENGLPSRRIESWHYTDLRTLLREIPAFRDQSDEKLAAPLVADSHVLGILGGQAAVEGQAAGLTPLKSLLGNGSVALPQNFNYDDTLGQINTALVSDGWKIDVPAHQKNGQIIEIQHVANGGQAHSRTAVTIGAGASAVIIERQTCDNQPDFVSTVSDLSIGENAEVLWIIVRERGLEAIELNQFNAVLEAGVKLRLYFVNAGVKLLRQEINVDLQGDSADFQLRGINLLGGKTHTDTTMTVRHLVENTTSTEIIRNVTMDQARGVFQGMIRVAKEAQKTDARMACNTLVLSDDAEFDAKPELEIFADDVACGHGATVAEINHDHLFYLMARGIPEAEARVLLIKAFVGELIEELENKEIEEVLKTTIDQWLEKHI